jgi:hypothetical protein
LTERTLGVPEEEEEEEELWMRDPGTILMHDT